MSKHIAVIEFSVIRERLADIALTEKAKERARALTPSLREAEVRQRLLETTGARNILDSFGTPPLSSLQNIKKAIQLSEVGAMLVPEQLAEILLFLTTCGRAKRYLKQAEAIDDTVATYGQSLYQMEELAADIDLCIRNDAVDDQASPELRSIRRKIITSGESIKAKLESMLRSKKEWFSEGFIVMRGGRYALPVKKAYRSQVGGAVVDISSSGNTIFIEPEDARKLTDALAELRIAEDNEIRRILYTLSAQVASYHRELAQNIDCMEILDFVFAKAQLSAVMKAKPPQMSTERKIRIVRGRHPLLDERSCVPLDFEMGGDINGVIITGPNTGGKTVALKTVGLLSMMAQSGLHVPAAEGSLFAMHANVLCDIGDGQSITENLSTFSSHMTNIIGILRETTHESLVLLDELGSGTDPAEGMGLAVAILEELRQKGCLLVATSHYPEIKEYAQYTPGMTNARMAFDRETLEPLYALQMGEAGESCAIYIAERLGFPAHMLETARRTAYSAKRKEPADRIISGATMPRIEYPSQIQKKNDAPAVPRKCDMYKVGDSVRVFPQKEIGIVYRRADEKGIIGVQIRNHKLLVPHKRIKLVAPAEQLYPEGYDLSVVLDSVENRKARHKMEKGHRPDLAVRYEKNEQPEQV